MTVIPAFVNHFVNSSLKVKAVGSVNPSWENVLDVSRPLLVQYQSVILVLASDQVLSNVSKARLAPLAGNVLVMLCASYCLLSVQLVQGAGAMKRPQQH